MLDAHPDLAIPPESHFIPLAWRVRRRYEGPNGFNAELLARQIMHGHRFREWELPEEAVWRQLETLERPDFTSVIEAFFVAYSEFQGKPKWGDKTPNYSADMPLLATLWPDARFVHVVRDGRNVSASLLEIPRPRMNITEAAQMWSERVKKGAQDGLSLGDRYLEIRYEDLLADASHILALVCDHVDLDFRPEMLEFSRSAPSSIPTRSWEDYHRNLAKPLTVTRDWRASLAAAQVAAIEAVAGNELTEFGYERHFEIVPFHVRVKARLTVLLNKVMHLGWKIRITITTRFHPNFIPPPRRWL